MLLIVHLKMIFESDSDTLVPRACPKVDEAVILRISYPRLQHTSNEDNNNDACIQVSIDRLSSERFFEID